MWQTDQYYLQVKQGKSLIFILLSLLISISIPFHFCRLLGEMVGKFLPVGLKYMLLYL